VFIGTKLCQEHGYTESQFGAEMGNLKRGALQKAYGWALLNGQNPELNIAKRLGMAPELDDKKRAIYRADGPIDYRLLETTSPAILRGRSGKPAPDAIAVQVLDNGYVKGVAATPVELEEYLRFRITGTGKATPALSKQVIQGCIDGPASGSDVAKLLTAILSGSQSGMNKHAKSIKARLAK
jgi:hypothetical protein